MRRTINPIPAISTTILYQSGVPSGVPFSNQYGYAGKPMDDLIARAATALDPRERASLYHAFQKLAGDEQPIIHVAEFTFITVARASVRGVANNPRWATSHWADTWLQT